MPTEETRFLPQLTEASGATESELSSARNEGETAVHSWFCFTGDMETRFRYARVLPHFMNTRVLAHSVGVLTFAGTCGVSSLPVFLVEERCLALRTFTRYRVEERCLALLTFTRPCVVCTRRNLVRHRFVLGVF